MGDVTTLILPGLGDSGPDHWQSHWERRDASCRRVVQREWDSPDRAEWVEVLDAAIASAPPGVVLAGHSTACALVAHWAETASPEQRARVRGALLVAPSDPYSPIYPEGPTGFGPVPLAPIPFPTIVVASTDDPYVSLERATEYANAWGSRLVVVENGGHLSTAAGYGPWPEGYALLEELRGM